MANVVKQVIAIQAGMRGCMARARLVVQKRDFVIKNYLHKAQARIRGHMTRKRCEPVLEVVIVDGGYFARIIMINMVVWYGIPVYHDPQVCVAQRGATARACCSEDPEALPRVPGAGSVQRYLHGAPTYRSEDQVLH